MRRRGAHYEYERLLAELPGYLKPVLTMAYWTGCRKSEILGFKWSQVDLLNRQITLETRSTKNNEPRIIPIAGELYRTLLSLRPTRGCQGPARELVFTHDGEPIRYICDAWRAATERAGLKGLLLHDCHRAAVRNLVPARVPERVARAISARKTASVFD